MKQLKKAFCLCLGFGLALCLHAQQYDSARSVINDPLLNDYFISQKDTLGKKYTIIQKPAVYRGGLQGWTSFLEKNLNQDMAAKYVKLKKTDSIGKQTVYVMFTVEPHGLVANVTAEKGDVHSRLVEEALRVVNASPRWVPAEFEMFENTNGKIPIQKILERKKNGGFAKVPYRHKQGIAFVCTRG